MKSVGQRLYKITKKFPEKKQFERFFYSMKTIIDNLPMMIVYKDIENNVITVNLKTANILNKNINDLSNITTKSIFPNEYRKYFIDDLKIINTKKERLDIIETVTINSEVKIISSSKIPIFDENKNVCNILICSVDITEKVKLEKENESLLFEKHKSILEEEILKTLSQKWRQPLFNIKLSLDNLYLQLREKGIDLDDIFLDYNAEMKEIIYNLEETLVYKKIIYIKDNYFWDFNQEKLFWNTNEVKLSRNERKILNIFCINESNILSYDQISEIIWNDLVDNPINPLRTMINGLRKKLPNGVIKNIYGYGYMFKI